MAQKKLTRRKFVATVAAAGASTMAAPFVRRANAAGSLSIGLWDHWVPGANDVQTAIVKEWGEKEKVDVKIDYITSQGNKLLLTIAAEFQAKSGHDILEFTNWESAQHADQLEDHSDLEKKVLAANGPVEPVEVVLEPTHGCNCRHRHGVQAPGEYGLKQFFLGPEVVIDRG